MQELGFHLLNTVTWFKPNAAPNLACRFFTHSTEILLWAAPMRSKPLAHRFNYREMKQRNGGKQMRDLWEIAERPEPGGEQVVWPLPTPGPREKLHGRHPTQKPLALLDRVIAASSARATWCSTPSAAPAPPAWPRSAPAAASSGWKRTPSTSTCLRAGCGPRPALAPAQALRTASR